MDKNVVCLKWGTKYAPEYVNKLHNMVTRNLTHPHRFVCFTEDTTGINSGIETRPLLCDDKTIRGWWHKLAFFQEQVADLKGTMLFLDLDIVITNNIDCFFDYKPDKFCIIHEWIDKRKRPNNPQTYNSSVFRINVAARPGVWKTFLEARPDGPEMRNVGGKQAHKMRKNNPNKVFLHGDQNWIEKRIKDACFWPDMWAESFKYGSYDRNDPNVAKIIIFHGIPDPHDAAVGATRKTKESPWILSSWRNNPTIIEIEQTNTEASMKFNGVVKTGGVWKLCVGNTVSKITIKHVLTGLTYDKAQEKIDMWYQRLQPKGELVLTENNIKGVLDNPNQANLKEMFGQEDGGERKLSGYTYKLLEQMLQKAGFINISGTNTNHLKISCKK